MNNTDPGWGEAHLEGCWDNNHSFSIGVFIWELGEYIAELEFLSFRNSHSPETIFDVQFAEEDGSIGGGLCCQGVDDASQGASQLGHGVGGGGVRIGGFVD